MPCRQDKEENNTYKAFMSHYLHIIIKYISQVITSIAFVFKLPLS